MFERTSSLLKERQRSYEEQREQIKKNEQVLNQLQEDRLAAARERTALARTAAMKQWNNETAKQPTVQHIHNRSAH